MPLIHYSLGRIRAALAEELFVRYKIHAVRQGEFNSRLNDHLLYRVSGRMDVGGAKLTH